MVMMRSLISVSIILVVLVRIQGFQQESHEDEVKDYTGHHLIRVMPDSEEQRQLLQNLKDQESAGVNFWLNPAPSRPHVDIHLSPTAHVDIKEYLSKAGIAYNTLTDNIESLIEEERQHSRHRRSVLEFSNISDSFNHSFYHTFGQINDWLEFVATSCGDKCSLFSIGQSTEGRDLKVIKIGTGGSNKPVIWIDAGIHAREWISPATALYIIAKLLDNSRISRYLTTRITWYILPIANPDGYVYTWTHDRMWRKTRSAHQFSRCRGVDPNRNWEYFWSGPGTSAYHCSENYRGPRPFSEPETLAMSNFLRQIQSNLTVYLSLHSYGQYWLTPWGYTKQLPQDYDVMHRLGLQATRAMRRAQGTHYDVGSSSRLLYLAAGGSDDWVKGVLGVPYAYTVELRDTGRHGFILPATYITQTGEEMFAAIRTLGLKVVFQRQTQVRQGQRQQQQQPTQPSYVTWRPRRRGYQ